MTPVRTARLLAALLPCTLPLAAHAASGKFVERAEVRKFVAEMHEKHGMDQDSLLRLFRKAEPQPGAIKAIMPPSDPAIRSWRTYRARYIEPVRLEGGLRFWEARREVLEEARRTYGVPEEIIVAIIGVETIYGRNTGRFPTFATLATLAFNYPPRAALFRGELEALLLLASETRRDPLGYRGSYAGALGLPQFLPSSVRNWAVDFDRNGRLDLTASAADAIGSVANFLRSHGWEVDGPVALPATTAGDQHGVLLEDGILPRLTPAEMIEFGIGTHADAPQAPCALIDLVTPGAETEYRLGYRNFYVLTRYNRSSFYALAVHELAQELRAAHDARLAGR